MGFWSKKSVVVTGGAGFLGSFIVKQLHAKDSSMQVFVPRSKDYNLVLPDACERLIPIPETRLVLLLRGPALEDVLVYDMETDDAWPLLELDWRYFTPHNLEFYGQVNFLKGGLVFADALTSVSRRYAEEITKPEQGHGLDGVLRERRDALYGILNGVDYALWDPERDPYLDAIRGERFEGLIGELKSECDGYRRLYHDLQASRSHDSNGGEASKPAV